jgi:hypothetical protein
MFEFIFGTSKQQNPTPIKHIIKPVKNNFVLASVDSNKSIFLVLNKYSQQPLGIFDSLEKAKLNGQKSTFFNCSIFEFKLNDSCKFLNDPIFEN